VVDAKPQGFEGVLTRLYADELVITSVKSPLIARTRTSAAGLPTDEKTFTLQVVYAGRCCLATGTLRPSPAWEISS